MSYISTIKSFLDKLWSSRNFLKSRSKDIVLNLNGVIINISKNRDITISNARFIEIEADALFLPPIEANREIIDKIKLDLLNNSDRAERIYSNVSEEQILKLRKEQIQEQKKVEKYEASS